MPRPLSIFLSSLVILGIIQLGCRVLAQSPKEITNSIGMKLVLIPKGTFMMGSPESEVRIADATQHEVTISKDYYLGLYEVTQAQYEKMMVKNPSRFQGDNLRGDSLRRDSTNHPVEQVSWADAVEFCKTLSELPEEKKAGRVYRLPTEAEWEYACGAGSRAVYSFSESQSLGDYAWFGENSHEKTHPVGQKTANAWGLHDMYGNVWEWCNDWHGKYPKGTISDPTGPKDGSNRVGRGGSWCDFAFDCRRAPRYGVYPSIRDSSGGFRVALSPSAIPQ